MNFPELHHLDKITKTVEKVIDLEVQKAIIETDWEETPILDVKIIHPPVGVGSSLLPEVKVERYESEAPKIGEVGVDGKKTEVYRFTEPMLEHVTEKYGVAEWLTA